MLHKQYLLERMIIRAAHLHAVQIVIVRTMVAKLYARVNQITLEARHNVDRNVLSVLSVHPIRPV